MSFTDTKAWTGTDWFRDRVNIAMSAYTNYLIATPVQDPDYDLKTGYATRLGQQNTSVMNTLMFSLPGDPEVQTWGPAITDAQITTKVQQALEKYYPMVPPETPASMRAGYSAHTPPAQIPN